MGGIFQRKRKRVGQGERGAKSSHKGKNIIKRQGAVTGNITLTKDTRQRTVQKG